MGISLRPGPDGGGPPSTGEGRPFGTGRFARPLDRLTSGPVWLWLAVLFAGSAALGAWFLLAPLRGSGPFYRPVPNRLTYGYSRFVVMLFVPYALALAAWWRGARIQVWTLLAGALTLHLIVLFAPLPQSQDFYQYLFYGRMQAALGANPYVVLPNAFSHDAWFPMVSWPNQATVYGPAWMLLASGAARVAGDHFAVAYAGLKLVVLALDATIMAMLVAATRDRPDPAGAAGWALLAFAWNPLVLITVPLGGAADTAAAAAVLGALLARRRGHSLLTTGLLSLAALVKLYAGVGLLLHLVLVARERGLRRAAGHAAVSAGIAVTLYAPYWSGYRTFRGVLRALDLANRSLTGTVQELLASLLRRLGVGEAANDAAAAMRWIVAILLAAVLVWAIRTVRTEDALWLGVLAVLAAYVLLTPWYEYWYLLTPLALVAVLPTNRLTFPFLTFSGTTMITAVFPPWLLGRVTEGVLRYAPPLAVFARWGRRPWRGSFERPPSEKAAGQHPEATALLP